MIRKINIYAVSAVLAAALFAACAPAGQYTALEIAEAVKDLRGVIPAIQAGLALVSPDDPAARALTPANLETAGVDNPWAYGTDTPAEVYVAEGGTTGTIRLPASGNYQLNTGDLLYFTLTPETALGATYYRVILYLYPSVDFAVAYTVEEYVVDAAESSGIWAWGNRDATGASSGWVSQTTVYTDGTTGRRTTEWTSSSDGTFYEAFAVTEPDPDSPASFVGYRYEELNDTPPVAQAGAGTWSSETTEVVTGKVGRLESTQFYTETTATTRSGLTYVFEDRKKRWAEDIQIVTRMEQDTAAGTKTVRSVGEIVGGDTYYIDKVDIGLVGGKVTYSSSHDVYGTALPRGGDAGARDYSAMALTEDSAGAGTFTGTLELAIGNQKHLHRVTVARDRHFRFAVTIVFDESTARSFEEAVSIPITRQDIGSLSIPVADVGGTFDGYYETGNLAGTLTTADRTYEVVVAEEGVAVDDVLYPY